MNAAYALMQADDNVYVIRRDRTVRAGIFGVTLRVLDGKPSYDPGSVGPVGAHTEVSPPWSQTDRHTTRSLTIRKLGQGERTFRWRVQANFYEVRDRLTVEATGISVTLRNLHGRPSYDPASIRPAGTQAEASPAWGDLSVDSKRTLTLTAPNGESAIFEWCGGDGCAARNPGAVPLKPDATSFTVTGGSDCTLSVLHPPTWPVNHRPLGWRYIWRNGNSTKITDGGVKWTNLRNTRYWVQVAPYGGPHNPLEWSDRSAKVTVSGCP